LSDFRSIGVILYAKVWQKPFIPTLKTWPSFQAVGPTGRKLGQDSLLKMYARKSCRPETGYFGLFYVTAACTCRKEAKMEMKKVLAGWSKICPGCNIGRKYPDSFIGKKVRNHWESGCISHNAYVEVYGSDEPSPKKIKEKSDDK
jgi:hypothetical protein